MQVSLSIPWALTALFLIPLLALLQLLLPRSRRVTVGSLMFWEDVGSEPGVSGSARSRRLTLRSVLLLGALAAAIVALAGPQLVRSEPTGPAGVIVVDRSPSVLMTDGGGETRLVRLRASLARFLAGLPDGLPVAVRMVPEIGRSSRLEGTVGEIRSHAVALVVAAGEALTGESLRREVLSEHDRSGAPVLMVTDISPYGDGERSPRGVWVAATGGRSENIAVTGAGVRYRAGRPFAMVETFSSCAAERACRLRLTGPGVAVDEPLVVSPGARAVTLALPGGLGDRVTLSVEVADDFASDNRLTLIRVAARRYRVGVVGSADGSVMRFLGAAGAEVTALDGSSEAGAAAVDVTVFSGQAPPAGFKGPAIVVNPGVSMGSLVLKDATGGPGSWEVAEAGSPLVRYLPEEGPHVRTWPVYEAGAGVTVVLRSAGGDPLVADWSAPGGRRVGILFDIGRTNTSWSMEPSFVVFWANCLRALSPAGPTEERFEAETVWGPLMGQVEGRQARGARLDETAGARSAFVRHEREVRPVVFPLWMGFAIVGVALLIARVWVLP